MLVLRYHKGKIYVSVQYSPKRLSLRAYEKVRRRGVELSRKSLKRINRLLKDIDRNGYESIGKPEPLGGDLSGYWSVRIDDKNRIVFRIHEGNLEILQCGTHYREK